MENSGRGKSQGLCLRLRDQEDGTKIPPSPIDHRSVLRTVKSSCRGDAVDVSSSTVVVLASRVWVISYETPPRVGKSKALWERRKGLFQGERGDSEPCPCRRD